MSKLKRLINRFNRYSPKGIVTNTKQWISAADGIDRGHFEEIELGHTRQIDLNAAQAVSKVDRFLKNSHAENESRQFKGQTLFILNGVRLVGSEPDIISSDGLLLNDLGSSKAGSDLPNVFYRRKFSKPTELAGKFLNLCFLDSKNYYHWLIESLPNVRCVESKIKSFTGVFIPKNSTFQKQSLLALGFQADQFIELDQTSHFRCETLYQPSYNSGYTPFDWHSQWIRSKTLLQDSKARTEQAVQTERRLFISRGSGSGRKLTNEEQVFNLLASHGFELFDPCDHSFHEQAQAYSQSNTIVSVHGAGLANIVFCQPDTTILEIFPAFWTPLCYFQLAYSIGLDYHFMLDLPLDTSEDVLAKHEQAIEPDESRFQSDLSIPLDKLEIFLQNL